MADRDQIVLINPQGQRFVISPGVSASRDPNQIQGIVRVSVRRSLSEQTTQIPKRGVEVTYLGYDHAEVSLEVRVWRESEFSKLDNLIQLFRAKTKAQAAPQVYQPIHPILRRHGITHLYIFGVEEPAYDPVRGFTTTFTLREWRSTQRKIDTERTQVTTQAGFAGADRDGTPTPQQRAQTTPPSARGVRP
jgi:hypothetical protein